MSDDFFDSGPPANRWLVLAGNAFLLALVLYWTRAVFQPHPEDTPPWIFLDDANLIFHEAGHIIFLVFGDFLHVLGGSLTQVLVPLIVFVAFLRQESFFAAGFALYWIGESLANISYYVADARAEALPLLGGDSSGHDWHWLLADLGRLQNDTLYGRLTFDLAALLMLAGIAGMVYAMWRTAQGRE